MLRSVCMLLILFFALLGFWSTLYSVLALVFSLVLLTLRLARSISSRHGYF